MTSALTLFLVLAFPLLAFGVPSEKLTDTLRQGRRPPRQCSNTCYPGKGKAYQECGGSRNTNSDCYLSVCEQTNLGGKIHAGYRCVPYYVEPSYPPYPRYTPEPRETFAPVPDIPCADTCRDSQTLADDDCMSQGNLIAGCRVDSACTLSTGSGYQCAAYDGVTGTKTFVASLDGLELIIQYSWGIGQFDIDSATEFLGDKVGVSCDTSGTYIEFLGDNTSEAGTESYIISISDALNAGAWSGSTIVNLYAGWFSDPQSGPITISASLRDASSGAPIPNSEISIQATTSEQTGCSTYLLGQVSITELADSVSLEIAPQ